MAFSIRVGSAAAAAGGGIVSATASSSVAASSSGGRFASPGPGGDLGLGVHDEVGAPVGDGLEGGGLALQVALPELGENCFVLRAEATAHEHDLECGGERHFCLGFFLNAVHSVAW